MPRPLKLAIALILIGTAIAFLELRKPPRIAIDTGENAVAVNPDVATRDAEQKASRFPRAQEIVAPAGFINTAGEPFTLSSRIGKKVILVDFWTYSCINCVRTQPYLNAWYEKYKDHGLEIVGIHTPEFAFEKERANVEEAVAKAGIEYPVVLDNDYGTWDAYKNRYWPAHYSIDINGLIVSRHIGEGGYEETEREIQKLLEERKEALGESGDIPGGIVTVIPKEVTGSPETYFGWSRNSLLGNGVAGKDGVQIFTRPAMIVLNKLYLEGTWDIRSEFAENTSPASIIFKYNAKEVYFVADADSPVTITILRDGAPVSSERGADIAEDGTAQIHGARMYKLIREEQKSEHVLEIRIEQKGLKAFTFTFG